MQVPDYISPVTAISIQIDLQLTRMYDIWLLSTLLTYQSLPQHSIHMLSHNQPWIPMQVPWLHFTRTAISIQIDLQLIRNVSHMVARTCLRNQSLPLTSIDMLSIITTYPHASAMTTFPPVTAISIQIDLQLIRNVHIWLLRTLLT